MSAIASSQLGTPSLTGQPNDTFLTMGKFLQQNEVATVACVDRNAHLKVGVLRSLIRHLDISFNANRPNLSNPVDLTHALRLHPNFNSIDFSGYKHCLAKFGPNWLSTEAGLALRAAFKARNMKVVIARGTQFAIVLDKSNMWKELLCDLDHVIEHKASPGTLEHLDLEGVEVFGLMEQIAVLTSRSPQLKKVIIPLKSGAEWDCEAMIRMLPPSLEFLGPNWCLISDELANSMMGRLILGNLRGCNLTFTNSKDSSEEKRFEFFRFLPFESMDQIELAGAKTGVRRHVQPYDLLNRLVISDKMINHITPRLAQNAELKVLKLTGLIPSENLTTEIVNLINSIQSPKLEELGLFSHEMPDMTPIFEALMAKLPQWPHIRTIQIGKLSMSNFQPASRYEEGAIPILIELVNAPRASIHADRLDLNRCSIPFILTHYANRHNQLNQAKRLAPSQIIVHFKSLISENHTSNWTTPTELVERVLEPGLQRIRQQQNAEHEQMREAASAAPAEQTTQQRREAHLDATQARLTESKDNL